MDIILEISFHSMWVKCKSFDYGNCFCLCYHQVVVFIFLKKNLKLYKKSQQKNMLLLYRDEVMESRRISTFLSQ